MADDPRAANASVGMVEDSVAALNKADVDEADRRAGADQQLAVRIDAEASARIHDVGALTDRLSALENLVKTQLGLE